MLARNVTHGQLADAAHRTGVQLFELRQANVKATAWRFRIVPLPERDEYGWKLYQASSSERKVHAVCWHGHREFYAELFVLAPDAVVRTAMAVWTKATLTEDNLSETFRKNIGSQMYPVWAGEACNCEAGPTHSVWWNGSVRYTALHSQ